ncbi:hypothetical protein N566_17350 [Streptomycetaceae bacterium MP113-05]|nr:hypothetical protein N566_17350 [Streptomycetaceae bacterium MP113-05]
MASSAVAHRALDGVSYRIEGDDLDLRSTATSAVEILVGGHLFEFTSGPAGLVDGMAASLGVTAFDTELAFQNGTLRTATTREYDPQSQLVETPTLVTWQGRKHSLVTRLYRSGTEDVLALLRAFRITEHDDGLSLAPDAGADCRFTGPAAVIKEVPGLGLVEMSRRTKERSAQLPPWQGGEVPTGELYRDTLSDGRPFFVLSGSRLWATVVPLADTAVEHVPDMLARCTLRAV